MTGYKIPKGFVEGYRNTIERYPKDSQYAWGMNAVVEALEVYPLEELDENPWHTGTPTITGFYAVKFKDGSYDVILYDNGKVFEGDDPLCGWDIYSDDKPKDIIKWQLLEEASE